MKLFMAEERDHFPDPRRGVRGSWHADGSCHRLYHSYPGLYRISPCSLPSGCRSRICGNKKVQSYRGWMILRHFLVIKQIYASRSYYLFPPKRFLRPSSFPSWSLSSSSLLFSIPFLLFWSFIFTIRYKYKCARKTKTKGPFLSFLEEIYCDLTAWMR